MVNIGRCGPSDGMGTGRDSPHNRTTGFLILVPFLVFAIFPANTQSFYPYPGLDGFGIYNRHTSLLLYVLMCGLLFMRNGTKLALFARQ